MWVLFTIVDSALLVYSKYVRTLDDDEQAAYWDDNKIVGKLFGLRRRDMPDTLDDLRDYEHEMLTSGRLVRDRLGAFAGAEDRARSARPAALPTAPARRSTSSRSVYFPLRSAASMGSPRSRSEE